MRLNQAAISEFARNGIDATSIETLCEAAGFTRGAFYSNYASKDDICLAIMRDLSADLIKSFEEALAQLPEEIDPLEVIPMVVGRHEVSIEAAQAQREIELRASRRPEFAQQLRGVQLESWGAYRRFAEAAFTRAGFESRIDFDDLLHIFQALYRYPDELEPAGQGRAVRLINVVASRLTRPLS